MRNRLATIVSNLNLFRGFIASKEVGSNGEEQ